jgi:hypothetical protein
MDYRRHDHAMRRPITAKLIGHQSPRRSSLALHQLAKKPLSGTPIAASLEQDIDHVAILIDGAPQILPPTADLHEDLVQMPRVAELRLPPTGSGGVVRPELLTPATHGLVGHLDASLGQEILDVSETQRESVVEPHCVADDLRWEPMPAVAGRPGVHQPSLPGCPLM